ncbi:MAG: hypothetical protein R6U35_07895 [Candidatus Humimicrobiaceae bacterium]
MLGLNNKLKNFAKKGYSIKVAICGLGHMGTGLVSHILSIPGMDVVAVITRNIGKAEKALNTLARNKQLEIAGGKPSNRKDRIILTDDIKAFAHMEELDAIIDATGSPQAGAEIGLFAIENKKDLISLNVEADTVIGPILSKLAKNAGIVYTLAAGDEPGALKELYDFADALGFEIIVAGKGKNNPLDREANPSKVSEYAREKGANPKMMCSFIDGTKTMIEMACFSNATGLVADCKGMHGIEVNVSGLVNAFKLKPEGGILNRKGVVDFVIGDVAPGVFLVYRTESQVLREELRYLMFGDGPNYLLYRPYHLASLEVPLSIARAFFYREATIIPKAGLISDIATIAKKNLKKGDRIDGIGGYSVYGLIDRYETIKGDHILPIGLSEGCRMVRDKKKGEIITLNDVEINDTMLYQLKLLQEKVF